MIIFIRIFLALLGVPLGVAGSWLIVLGGSWYHFLAGIAFVATAFLLYRKRQEAFHLFALIVLGSLNWANYEVGVDWWALDPRGGLIVILGVLLLVPWWQADHKHGASVLPAWRSGGRLLIGSLVAGGAWLHRNEGRRSNYRVRPACPVSPVVQSIADHR